MKSFLNLFFIFALFFLLFYHIRGLYPVVSDEGQITAPAIHVLRGGVIYRDFFTFLSPGSIYLLAGLISIFGVKRIVLYLLTSFTLAVICTATYYLATKKFRTKFYSIAPIVLTFYPVCFSWYELSHHWLSSATAMVSFCISLSYLERKKFSLLFLSGIFNGLTLLFFHTKGLLLTGAFILALFADKLLKEKETSAGKRFKEISYFLLGSFLPVLPFVIYLFINGALRDAFYDLFVWVAKVYYPFNKYPYYFYYGFRQIGGLFDKYNWYAGVYYSSFFILAGFVPLIAILLGSFKWVHLLRIRAQEEFRIHSLFLFASLAFFASSLYRSDVPHLYFIIPLLLIVFFDGITYLLKNVSVLRLIALLTILYAVFGYLTIIKESKNAIPVRTPAGTVYTLLGKEVAEKWQNLFNYMEQQDLKDGDIFTYAHGDSLYYLLNIKPPTPYDCLFPGRNTREQLLDAISKLETRKPEFVLKDSLTEFILHNKYEASYPFAREEDFINDPVKRYIQEHYEVVQINSFLKIMKRRAY